MISFKYFTTKALFSKNQLGLTRTDTFMLVCNVIPLVSVTNLVSSAFKGVIFEFVDH